MTLKLGLNLQTLILAGIAVWLLYGGYQGGVAIANINSNGTNSNDYAAKTS